MESSGGSATDAFQRLWKAISASDLDWTERISHFYAAYGFDEEFKNQTAKSEAEWLLGCLRAGGPRLRGLEPGESPVESIIKIEAGMITKQEAEFNADVKDSFFFPWMGGRWERAAICLLSILNGNLSVKRVLEDHQSWLNIPSVLEPMQFIQVLPVKKTGEGDRDSTLMRPEVEMISNSQNESYSTKLVLEHRAEDLAEVDSILDTSSGSWISICQPISKWEMASGSRVITVPTKRWHFVTNPHQRYDIPDRGQQ